MCHARYRSASVTQVVRNTRGIYLLGPPPRALNSFVSLNWIDPVACDLPPCRDAYAFLFSTKKSRAGCRKSGRNVEENTVHGPHSFKLLLEI